MPSNAQFLLPDIREYDLPSPAATLGRRRLRDATALSPDPLAGRRPMNTYRLYLLDANGHICSATEIACADDEAAKAVVRERNESQAHELWLHARRIAVFPGRRERA